MHTSTRIFVVSVLLVAAYVAGACGGTLPAAPVDDTAAIKVLAAEVEFTGTVESIDGDVWVVDGQSVTVDLQNVDPNIQVGDTVKVEGVVAEDGTITATEIESSVDDDVDDADDADDDDADDDDADDDANDDADDDQESFGVIEAITDTTITIDGTEYTVADFSEIEDSLAVGDQVKIHFIVNPDGTLTIREIELSDGLDDVDDEDGDVDDDDADDEDDADDDSDGGDSGSNDGDGDNSGDDD